MDQNSEGKRSGSSAEVLPVSSGLDRDNPRSLINILPNSIQPYVDAIPTEYLGMSEYELELHHHPDPFTSRVRIAFWEEYEHAQANFVKINFANIALRIGTLDMHIKRLFRDPLKAAWILCPPTSYTTFLDEALRHGLKRIRDNILTLSVHDDDGNISHRNLELILKATAFLDMRKNGAMVTKNLHLHATQKDGKDLTKQLNKDEIEEKIKELESKLGRSNEVEVTEAPET